MEGEVPHVSYHRKCRSLFTMKEDLESISQTTAAPSQIAEFNKRRAKTPSRRAKHDQNASKICIFCQKTTAYKKGARICDPLSAFTCV